MGYYALFYHVVDGFRGGAACPFREGAPRPRTPRSRNAANWLWEAAPGGACRHRADCPFAGDSPRRGKSLRRKKDPYVLQRPCATMGSEALECPWSARTQNSSNAAASRGVS